MKHCNEPIDTVSFESQVTSKELHQYCYGQTFYGSPWLRSGLCLLIVHLFLVSRCTPCLVRQKSVVEMGWFRSRADGSCCRTLRHAWKWTWFISWFPEMGGSPEFFHVVVGGLIGFHYASYLWSKWTYFCSWAQVGRWTFPNPIPVISNTPQKPWRMGVFSMNGGWD